MSDEESAKPLSRRLVTATATLTVVIVLPVVLAFIVAGPSGAGGAALGALLAFIMALMAGWRRSAVFLVPSLIAVAASATLAGTPWWTLGLTALGLSAGLLAARGLLLPMAVVGIAWSVAQPTDPASDLLILLACAAVAAVYAVLVARRMGLPGAPEQPVTSGPRAFAGAIGLAAAAGIAAVIAQNWDSENAYWLPMTVFVLAIPAPGAGLSQRASSRVVGTAVGVGVAFGLTTVISLPLVDYALALVAIIAALAVPTPPWFNASLISAAIVLALTPTSGDEVGGSRLGATALAAVIVVAIAGVLALAVRLLPTSGDQVEQLSEFEAQIREDNASPST